MRQRTLSIIAAAMAAAVWGLPSVRAQDGPNDGLPLKDVVLFSSGVGYFQREGRVNGNVDVPLSFRTDQVNDILKSLVLFDTTGGVRPVTYTTKDALSRRLHGIGQGINGSISLGSLLRQFQGARIRLQTGAEAVEGRIVSVSLKAVPVKEGAVQTEVVNVLTESGLRAIPLDGVGEIKLLDERLDKDLRSSLELLATGLDDERRTVELHFAGNGARDIRAGYLQEMPIWKTTYRLVLDDKQQPYVQGWALVENTTDEDWKGVRLSLVSGRPVSFIQDLYQPLYVPRPIVQAQVVGSPNPQTYGETLELGEAQDRVANANGTARMPRVSGAVGQRGAAGPTGGGFGMGGFGGGGLGGYAGAPGPAGPPGPRGAGTEEELAAIRRDQSQLKARMGVSAAQMAQTGAQAAGGERGELFEYAISQPVTLPRQQAAMVPILSDKIGGEKLSIFDPASDTEHAMNGFLLKNTTGMHLSGGPITVFQSGAYAGDAQINYMRPGEDRLLAYAVDLDLAVGEEQPKFRQETLTISAKSGVLFITRKQQRERTYTFRNKTDAAKTVLVQQRIEPEFKLVQPAKPEEKTATDYRFKVAVPAKKTEKLAVMTERPITEQLALFDADLNVLISWAQNAQVSEKLRGSLKGLVDRRRHLTDLQNQRAVLEAEIKSIDQEQSRIRQNMAQLDRNNALYQQYVKKLTDQETRIERVREQIAKLREDETAAQKELRQYVDGLTGD